MSDEENIVTKTAAIHAALEAIEAHIEPSYVVCEGRGGTYLYMTRDGYMIRVSEVELELLGRLVCEGDGTEAAVSVEVQAWEEAGVGTLVHSYAVTHRTGKPPYPGTMPTWALSPRAVLEDVLARTQVTPGSDGLGVATVWAWDEEASLGLVVERYVVSYRYREPHTIEREATLVHVRYGRYGEE